MSAVFKCACGNPAVCANPDLTTVQCARCWWDWHHWCNAHCDEPFTAWPGPTTGVAA